MTRPGPGYLADRGRIAAVRRARAPQGPTARPTTSLADLVELPAPVAAPRVMDTPRVQAGHRLYLPECLPALGWQQRESFRVWVERGIGTLTRGERGRGRLGHVGQGNRLTLDDASAAALGADPGTDLVALITDDADHVLLLGAAALADVAALTLMPAHVRRLVDHLHGAGPAATGALARLADRLADDELDALARVSVERLRELGVLGGAVGPAAGRGDGEAW